MKKLLAILALTLVAAPMFAQDSGWISLWDGKTFNGWKKAGENPDSFRIEDGAIISNGPRCHLFYVGDVHGAKFKNFELEVDHARLKRRHLRADRVSGDRMAPAGFRDPSK